MIRRLLRHGAALPYANRSTFTRASIALALPVGALLVCEVLENYIQQSSEIPFLIAVTLTTWFCGLSFGLAALGLATLLFVYFFLPPYLSFALHDAGNLTRLALFLAGNGVVLSLMHLLFQIHAELGDSEQRHRNLSELLPFGGWTSDAEGNMEKLSQSFLNTFRTTMEDCRGLGWTKLIAADQREQVIADWKLCMRGGYFWDYEYRMSASTGETYTVLSRGVPVLGPYGKTRHWVGIHLDITERERSAEQRIQQARDLARFNAELEQLAYVSSHDLQEPLRLIASYLQLLSRRYKGKLDADADTFIEYAVEGANRLRALLQDLMLLQQVGKATRTRKLWNLTELVSRALRNIQAQIDSAGAVIRYDDLPSVVCSDTEMVQLFENLIENAIQYRREQVRAEVDISAERRGNEWVVCVRDNGLGIEPEYLERIFDVFQRLHPRSEQSGTGIGLSICKKIVEVHGGRIWAESKPGESSAFRFTLPATF